jgi:murein DD-endopeptidase MepM/ murein hydrolase activator NlpD
MEAVMSRLVIVVFAAVALLAAGAVAMAATNGGGVRQQVAAAKPGSAGGDVVDLSAVADQKAKAAEAHSRPHEDVSEEELAAVERDIKRRSRYIGGAAPDDGIAPGAPSDKEVREAIREMRYGGSSGGSGDMIRPTHGAFTSPFGMRWGRLHAGIDLADPTGTPIRAALGGRVILAAPTGGYGNYTCIAHSSSISTCYAHQSRYGVSVGDQVRQGEVIGYVGNTGHSFGAHLHFEVRVNGRPVDPMKYL